jgi:hypothetical protein
VNRAERRRQEERVKRMWLRRLRRGRPLTTREAHEAWAQKYAPRFAHHDKCDCDTCTGFNQRLRRRDIKKARREAHTVERTGEEGWGDGDDAHHHESPSADGEDR